MSSSTADDQLDKPRKLQSSASLAEQNSAVSPLLDNIIGGAAHFSAASSEEEPADINNDSIASQRLDASSEEAVDPAVSRMETVAPKLEPVAHDVEVDSRAESPGDSVSVSQEDVLEPESLGAPEPVRLSEQYGNAGLLAELNGLAQAQQFQLEQHREYILRSRAEQEQQIENWKLRFAKLETQLQDARDRAAALEQQYLDSQSQIIPLEAQRDAAQQLTDRLQSEILDRRQQQRTLEEQLDLAEANVREQQEITAAQSRSIVAMQAELSQVQAEVAELETRLSHQGHLRQQLQADGNRDRQDRSKARDRQLQLEQETTQMKGQILRLSEELRQTQQQSKQWRRQAQTQAEQLRTIAHWAAQAESISPELMTLLEPLFNPPDDLAEEQQQMESPEKLSPENIDQEQSTAESRAAAAHNSSSLNLPNFPHGDS